jgi:hypothetical protein
LHSDIEVKKNKAACRKQRLQEVDVSKAYRTVEMMIDEVESEEGVLQRFA